MCLLLAALCATHLTETAAPDPRQDQHPVRGTYRHCTHGTLPSLVRNGTYESRLRLTVAIFMLLYRVYPVKLAWVHANRTRVQVKGGGHAMNPGFSSTPGVQIAMSRFNEFSYHPETNTADVGAGLIWDDVYRGIYNFI